MKRYIDELQAQYRALIIKQAADADQSEIDADEVYSVDGLLRRPASSVRILGGGVLGALAGGAIGGGLGAAAGGINARPIVRGTVAGSAIGGLAGALISVRSRLAQLKNQGRLQAGDISPERYSARRRRLAGELALHGGAIGSLYGATTGIASGIMSGKDVRMEAGKGALAGALTGSLTGGLTGIGVNRLFKGYRPVVNP